MFRAIVLSVTAAIALAGSSPARAADVVHVGITGAATDLPLFLAEKKGYFAKEGLSADLVSFDSGAKMVAPLGAGQLQAGAGATSAGLYNALNQGIAIKIVADKATITKDSAYKGIIVRKALIDSGQFKSLADLKGRKVAITAPGAADNSVINEAAKKAGLTIKDVDRIYLGFAAQIVALSNGGIDAAIGAEPDITTGIRQGIAVMFAPIPSFYSGGVQTSAVLLYGGDFMTKQHDAAVKFLKGYIQAVRDYDAAIKDGKLAGPGSDTVIQALMEMTKINDASLFRDMTAFWCNPDGRPDMASLERDLAYFKEFEGVTGTISVAQAMDTSLLDAALKDLGPAKK
jgi:NitT/TauT family transport system substrate-binding protein